MRVLLLTPDRNDRPDFLDHCRYQMGRQTLKAEHLVVNYDPTPVVVDLVPRVKKGLEAARSMNADCVLIIENDDYYPDNYVELMVRALDRFKIVGSDRTIYYSLQQNSLKIMNHPGRSSLFLTGFLVDPMKEFPWPDDTMLYFDIHLWQRFLGRRGFISFPQTPIGMKHGVGFSPGNFHNCIVNGRKMTGMLPDPGRKWLKGHVRKESFEFYQRMFPCQ